MRALGAKQYDYNSGKLESACSPSLRYIPEISSSGKAVLATFLPASVRARRSIILIFTKLYAAPRKNLHVTRIFHPLHVERLTNFTMYVYTKKPFSREGYSQNTHDSENAFAAYA